MGISVDTPAHETEARVEFSWKLWAWKAIKGGLFAAALMFVASPAMDPILLHVPSEYRVAVVGILIPAIKGWLKNKVGITLGGLL